MKKKCSFCGRDENEARLLISGMTGFICENCVEQAHDILLSSGVLEAVKEAKADKFKLKKVPKPHDIKAHRPICHRTG